MFTRLLSLSLMAWLGTVPVTSAYASTELASLPQATQDEISRLCLPVQYREGATAYRNCVRTEIDLRASNAESAMAKLSFDDKYAVQQACANVGGESPDQYRMCISNQITEMNQLPVPDVADLTADEQYAVQQSCFAIQSSGGAARYRQCINAQVTELRQLPAVDLSRLSLLDRNALQLECSGNANGAAAYRACLAKAVSRLAPASTQAPQTTAAAPTPRKPATPARAPAPEPVVAEPVKPAELVSAADTPAQAVNPVVADATSPATPAANESPGPAAAPVTAERIASPVAPADDVANSTSTDDSTPLSVAADVNTATDDTRVISRPEVVASLSALQNDDAISTNTTPNTDTLASVDTASDAIDATDTRLLAADTSSLISTETDDTSVALTSENDTFDPAGTDTAAAVFTGDEPSGGLFGWLRSGVGQLLVAGALALLAIAILVWAAIRTLRQRRLASEDLSGRRAAAAMANRLDPTWNEPQPGAQGVNGYADDPFAEPGLPPADQRTQLRSDVFSRSGFHAATADASADNAPLEGFEDMDFDSALPAEESVRTRLARSPIPYSEPAAPAVDGADIPPGSTRIADPRQVPATPAAEFKGAEVSRDAAARRLGDTYDASTSARPAADATPVADPNLTVRHAANDGPLPTSPTAFSASADEPPTRIAPPRTPAAPAQPAVQSGATETAQRSAPANASASAARNAPDTATRATPSPVASAMPGSQATAVRPAPVPRQVEDGATQLHSAARPAPEPDNTATRLIPSARRAAKPHRTPADPETTAVTALAAKPGTKGEAVEGLAVGEDDAASSSLGQWLMTQSDGIRSQRCIEFLIYWIAYADGRYDPALRDRLFSSHDLNEHDMLKRWVLQHDGAAFIDVVGWLRKHTTRVQLQQTLGLLMALLINEKGVTPTQNTLLRFLADAFGIGRDELEELFDSYFGHALPAIPRVDKPEWWSKQSAEDLQRWDADHLTTLGEHDQLRIRLGLDVGFSEAQVIQAFRRAARRCHPDRYSALGNRERMLAARQFSKFEEARDKLLGVSL